MDWEQYFEKLIDWKKFPAYRAEPRIDSLIGFYLSDILSDYLNIKIEDIIPELPLRLGTIHPEHNEKNFADRSYKVDFFAIGNNNKNYLIEFKTDPLSLRKPQDDYLNISKALGTKPIMTGIVKIAGVSSYKKKYTHLIEKLIGGGLLDIKHQYTGKNPECEIIYIIPSNRKKEKNIIDFLWIINWFKRKENLDEFEKAFSETLNIWFLEYSEDTINGA
jgi:hypothetical protein